MDHVSRPGAPRSLRPHPIGAAPGWTDAAARSWETAEAFCRYKLRHLREAHERATGTTMQRPGWLADG